MAWHDVNDGYDFRLTSGIFFITINTFFFITSILQLIRSCILFLRFNDNKVYLAIRIFNFITCFLLVLFSCIDIDFWIFHEDLDTIPDGIYYFNIALEACIDISICVTGSTLILELIRRYFEVDLSDQPMPNIINYFWFGMCSSFAFMVFFCLLMSFSLSWWLWITIYEDIRLLYLAVASCNLSYTYYWVFYKADDSIKKHLRISILFLLFAIVALIASFIFFVETFIKAQQWTLHNVVATGLNDAQNMTSYAVSSGIMCVGWMSYWFIMLWFQKIAWISSIDLKVRNTHEMVQDDVNNDV